MNKMSGPDGPRMIRPRARCAEQQLLPPLPLMMIMMMTTTTTTTATKEEEPRKVLSTLDLSGHEPWPPL
jgi:hypothetical protein